jgi:hypothetical protein
MLVASLQTEKLFRNKELKNNFGKTTLEFARRHKPVFPGTASHEITQNLPISVEPFLQVHGQSPTDSNFQKHLLCCLHDAKGHANNGSKYPMHYHASLLKSSIKPVNCVGAWEYLIIITTKLSQC